MYCVLHRHYVRDDLYQLAHELSIAVDSQFPGALTLALDANFPFLDGFPMIPHLSHDYGRKLDLGFYYAGSQANDYRRGQLASPIGYWAFERPREGEPQPCSGARTLLTLRWDQDWFQPLTRDDLRMDEPRMRAAIRWLQREGRQRGARRVLLEPHLAQRLGADRSFVRFQGCRVARHDDHFHLEVN
jgi:hypothetical protein